MYATLRSLLFAVLLSPVGVVFALPNWSFEAPSLGTTFSYFPEKTSASWDFIKEDGVGISGPHSPFTYANDLTGHGQVAFIQGHGAFGMNFFVQTEGAYVVTFAAAQRGAEQFGTQTISIIIDGVVRGSFTPLGSRMENHSSPLFTLGMGIHRLELRGTGSGEDFTAFIDDVAVSKVEKLLIKNDVASKVVPGIKCDATIADFGVNFETARDPFGAMIRVRHADKERIVSFASWFDPSPNTLFDHGREGCARGPYPQPTGPNNMMAQSTFQLAETGGGALLLSRDCVDSTNCHFFYGIQQYPGNVAAWRNDGDAVEFSIEIKVPMVNILYQVGEYMPVGQVYIALNATHLTDGRTIEFSAGAYETRAPRKVNVCDYYAGHDGPMAAVIQTTFSPHPDGVCENEKVTWVAEQQTTPFVAGGNMPERGVWSEYRRFTGRMTKEGLRKAIVLANAKQPGFDPDPANYKIGDLGFITEIIWFHPGNGIDIAVSWRNLEMSVHKAQ